MAELKFEAELPPLVMVDGVARVAGTRVPLNIIISEYKMGETPEKIVDNFTTVSLADAYTLIGYYLRHQAEVEVYLRQSQEHSEHVRRENEARFPSEGIKERLLARRTAKQKGE